MRVLLLFIASYIFTPFSLNGQIFASKGYEFPEVQFQVGAGIGVGSYGIYKEIILSNYRNRFYKGYYIGLFSNDSIKTAIINRRFGYRYTIESNPNHSIIFSGGVGLAFSNTIGLPGFAISFSPGVMYQNNFYKGNFIGFSIISNLGKNTGFLSITVNYLYYIGDLQQRE